MMRNIKEITILCGWLCLATLLPSGCTKGEGETIETAYFPPIIPELEYKFSKNGYSSINIQECSLLAEPITAIVTGMRNQDINTTFNYNRIIDYYHKGIDGASPKEEISRSPLHNSEKSSLENQAEELIKKAARLHGYNSSSQATRNLAREGEAGIVGWGLGDKNRFLVDEKGFQMEELFEKMMMGAVYLDKILNEHLDERFLDNAELRDRHEKAIFPTGKNYTELQHHWDLAYGYYIFWKPLVQAEGLPLLKDSERKIFFAFVQGRIELDRFRYEDMKKQLHIIREELSRAIAVRIMTLLIGDTTLVNLEEKPDQAFHFLSQAYGLIFAVQFSRNPEGKPYFTHEQIRSYLEELSQGKGFWEKKKLLAETSQQGSLKYIASQIGEPFGITLESIKR